MEQYEDCPAKFLRILKEYENNGTKYSDQSFPASEKILLDSSLYAFGGFERSTEKE